MIVLARDAIPRRRYRCVATGDLIEIAVNPKLIPADGILKQIRTHDGRFVHINAVSDGGETIPERIGSRDVDALVVPLDYQLEPWDGVLVPLQEPRPPVAAAKPGRGRGRPRKGTVPWMGWGRLYSYDMERLLEILNAEAGWVQDCPPHYYLAGFMAGSRREVAVGLYKSGELGFHQIPYSGPLRHFRQRERAKPPHYLPHRIDLSLVMKSGKWTEMVAALQVFLRNRKRVAAQHAKGIYVPD